MNYVSHNKLRTFHLFAGAGGGILADLLLGHLPVGACEIEEYPRNVLLQRQRDGILPAFPIWDDVCTLDGKPWRGTVDVLCGGFPCQDISAAGKGAGITGERSGLWREYARLIGEMRPKFVFAENSPLLRKRGLDVVLRDLANLGYNARWCVLGTRHIGGLHRRSRMWIFAYAKKLQRNGGTSGHGWKYERKAFPEPRNHNCQDIPADSHVVGQSGSGEVWRLVRAAQDFYRKTGQPFTDASGRIWPISEPCLRGGNDGLDYRMDRLKAIGNGQVPQVAALAFSILSEGLI